MEYCVNRETILGTCAETKKFPYVLRYSTKGIHKVEECGGRPPIPDAGENLAIFEVARIYPNKHFHSIKHGSGLMV